MSTAVRKDLTHLCRALKTPALLSSIDRLSKRAREESWSHEEFLAACLERELSARQTHGGDNRIKAARFPAQDARGLRLLLSALGQKGGRRPSRHPRLRRGERQRHLPGPPGNGKVAPRDRTRDPSLSGGPPGRVRDRGAVGRSSG